MINTWFGLTIICLFINSIIGQQLTNDFLINSGSTIKSTNNDQSDLKRTPIDNNKIKVDLSLSNGQSIDANVIKKPGNDQLIGQLDDKSNGLNVNQQKSSTETNGSKDLKDKNGDNASWDQILSWAGLTHAEFLVPKIEPRALEIKTRAKNDSSENDDDDDDNDDDDDDDEMDDDEDDDDDDDDDDDFALEDIKDLLKTRKGSVKTSRRSPKTSHKKSSKKPKKSKKKSKEKSKKKTSSKSTKKSTKRSTKKSTKKSSKKRKRSSSR